MENIGRTRQSVSHARAHPADDRLLTDCTGPNNNNNNNNTLSERCKH